MIKTQGIIIGIIPYSESSLILKIQSRELANISILAKGWRKKPEPLLRFCEYDFCVLAPKEEGLFLLKEAALQRDLSQYPSTSTWAAAEAGAELISKFLIPQDEAGKYYQLLLNYLIYLQNLEINGILIFWRLFSRTLIFMGIDPSFSSCAICATQSPAFAFNGFGETICEHCHLALKHQDQYTPLSSDARKILELLPEIGAHIHDQEPRLEVVGELNRLFISYFEAHQKQTLKLKSLSVLSQFYK